MSTLEESPMALVRRDLRGLRDRRRAKNKGFVARPRWQRTVVWSILATLLAGVLVGVFSGIARAEDEGRTFSFYRMASNVSAAFEEVQSPGSGKTFHEDGQWGEVLGSPASGGAVLGYVDGGFSFSVDYLISRVSGSSSSLNYASLAPKAADGEEDTSETFVGPLRYAQYGATLNGLGLDTMSTSLSFNFTNMLGGGLMLFNFALSSGVQLFFSGMIDFLQFLNPFRLLYDGVANTAGTSAADGMLGSSGAASGPFDGLRLVIGNVYTFVYHMSIWVLLPLMLGFLLASAVLMKRNNNLPGKIRKFATRAGFIVLGVPLLGAMYTGVLDGLETQQMDTNIGAINVVNSTYVDFETWAVDYRLAVPEAAHLQWNTRTGSPSPISVQTLRATTLAINNLGVTSPADFNPSDPVFTGSISGVEDTATRSDFMGVVNMLTRYMQRTQVSGGDFASALNGSINARISAGGVSPEIARGWFEPYISTSSNDLAGKANDFWGNDNRTAPGLNPVLTVSGEGLQGPRSAEANFVKFSSSTVNGCGTQVSTPSGAPMDCNMAPLAMYNYLNTSFGPTSMTIYSSEQASSGMMRESHNSVNAVGTGIMGFLYWTNSMALITAFNVIGLIYALGMVLGVMKRLIGVVATVPFAMMGALGMIAKFIGNVVAMVMIIAVTMFLYILVQHLLVGLPQIVEIPLSGLLSDDSSIVLFSAMPQMVVVLTTSVGIIMTIAFTVIAVRARKSVLGGMTELVDKFVSRFVGADAAPAVPGGGGIGAAAGALGSGLAAGAGMGAMSQMMGGGGMPGAGGLGKKPGTGAPGSKMSGQKPTGLPPVPGTPGNPLPAPGTPGSSPVTDVLNAQDASQNSADNPLTANSEESTEVTGSPVTTDGDPSGGGLPGSEGGTLESNEADQRLAAQVADNGLTPPDYGSYAPPENYGGAQGLPEAPAAGPDAVDDIAGVGEKVVADQQQHAELDRENLNAIGGVATAAGKGAKAAAQGSAGDVPGAVTEGVGAVNQLNESSQQLKDAADKRKSIGEPGANPTPSGTPNTVGGKGGQPTSSPVPAGQGGNLTPDTPSKGVAPSNAPVSPSLPTSGGGAAPVVPSVAPTGKGGAAPAIPVSGSPAPISAGQLYPSTPRATQSAAPAQAPAASPAMPQGAPVSQLGGGPAPSRTQRAASVARSAAANPMVQSAAIMGASSVLQQQAAARAAKKRAEAQKKRG